MATVGIFSRSSTENYQWLLQLLYTSLPKDKVHTVEITNYSPLLISGISFAILYHSKTRGRINITDVTDSLYNSELEELSKALGKENVIVVIDDLDDTSEQAKDRILENQPSIRILACDLLLFNTQGKQDGNKSNDPNRSKIQEMISERTTGSLIYWYNQFCACSGFNGRTYEICSHKKRILCLIFPAAVLCLYILLVYWYNCRVLQW
ncbi:uncharacterized protein LOC142656559 [Rhinoderma darwinii]|uniref:uncharacterized protein LOC142656559 n=1 Tax=Rhinoderma darwinii TaxID=43563 RepID=UPI003F66D6A0